MRYSIRIQGKVQPKQRPKFNRKTGTAYTPEKTANFESTVRYYAEQELKGNSPITGACHVTILLYKAVPSSLSKKKQEECLKNTIPVITKPDVDNVAKSILDALNGVWFLDDKQVVALYIYKRYAQSDYCIVTCDEV